jgi:hypothetical protein
MFKRLCAIPRPGIVRLKRKRRIIMRYLLAAAAVLSAMALGACDRQTASPPVVVNTPGPAGPQGAQGAPAEKGATGATGMTGAEGAKGDKGNGTIVVVPAPETQR